MTPGLCRRNLVYLVDRACALEVVIIVFFGSSYDWDESLNVMRDLHNLLTLQNVGVTSLAEEAKLFTQDFHIFCWLSLDLQQRFKSHVLFFDISKSVMARYTRDCILIHEQLFRTV